MAPMLKERGVRDIAFKIKYEGYIDRQILEAERIKKLENKQIPADVNYSDVTGIRFEAKEKFSKIKPVSIGQASRIPGITPCDISVLMVHLVKRERNSVSRET